MPKIIEKLDPVLLGHTSLLKHKPLQPGDPSKLHNLDRLELHNDASPTAAG